MLRNIVRLTIAILMLSHHSPVVAKAKPSTSPQPTTLSGYIHDHCYRNCVDPTKLKSAVSRASVKHHVPERLILSVVKVESGFRRLAVAGNQKGSMQIVYPLHRDRFHGRDPMSLVANVDVGTEILSECLARKHDTSRTARCYNGGGDPKYASKINKSMSELKAVRL